MNDFPTSLSYWASVSGTFISVYTADTTFSYIFCTDCNTSQHILLWDAVLVLLNVFLSITTAFITNNQVIFLLCMILEKILAKWTQKKMTSFYISSSALKLYLLLQVVFLFGVLGVKWCSWLHTCLQKLMEGGGKSAVKFHYDKKKKTSFGYIIFFLVE